MNQNGGAMTPSKIFSHEFKLQQIVFVVLILLSVIGVGITNLSPKNGHIFWFAMVLIVMVASVISGWKRSHDKGESTRTMLVTQLIHWSATLVAVLAVYILLNTGSLDYENTGMVVLLVLAFSTFLNGTHIGWRFYLAGSFLTLIFVVMAYVEEYIWILLLSGAVIGILGFYADRLISMVKK